MNRLSRPGRALGLAACLLIAGFLAACTRCGGGGPPTAGAPGKPAGATLGIAGQFLTGDDADALRSYLKTVKEITPKVFKVQWNPATVAVGREEAIRALRAVSRDGSTYTFAASEPVIGTLKPGSILWVWGVALRRVDGVATTGDATVVRTRPVALTEAMTSAQIEFESAVSAPDYFVAWRNPRKPAAVAQATRRSRPGLVLVRFKDGESGGPPEPQGRDEPPSEPEEPADQGEGEPTGNGFTGQFKGFEYSVEYATRPDGLTLTLEARKGEEGGEGPKAESSSELKKKFEEIEKEKTEAEKRIEEARKGLEETEKDLKNLDGEFQQKLSQLETDQANRSNPRFEGPRPPPPRTDSNGSPLTNQAERDLMRKDYERRRKTEADKMAELERILGEQRGKKAAAEEMKKALKVPRWAGKKLFEIASENLDVRFRVVTDLDNFDVSGVLGISDGQIDRAAAHFSNLQGHISVLFIGRFGQRGSGAVKVPLYDLPVAFNIPFPIYGIPFVIQLGADFNVNVFLAGQHAAMSFSGRYAFAGQGPGLGFHSDKSGSTEDGSISGEKPEVAKYEAMSPGVSAAVLGVQIPRVGIGLGLLGASSVAYVDVVNVVTITNSASVAMGPVPQCKRISYTAAGHVGIDTQVMPVPIPFVENAVNKKLSPKKELFNITKEVLDPPIKACEVN